jgi:hypothetical protein
MHGLERKLEGGKLVFLSKKEQWTDYSPGTEKECDYGENHWQPSEIGEGVLGSEDDQQWPCSKRRQAV